MQCLPTIRWQRQRLTSEERNTKYQSLVKMLDRILINIWISVDRRVSLGS